MTISVVVATYNRAARLEACLLQLERQAFANGDEVVVADNGSTDGTQAVLARASVRMGERLRVVRETRPGKSNAIAAALRDCRADVLAFTDDDVIVADDWVASIRQVMADPSIALVGGPVFPMYERRVPAWLDLEGREGFGRLAAPLALLHYGPERSPLGPRAALGANLAVRREAFDAAGGFPAKLGKLRGTLLSGEDHQLCERIQAAGYLAVYDPSIRVRHLVPAERMQIGYFLRWFFWSGVTHSVMDRARGEQRGRRVLGVPRFVVKRLAASRAGAAASMLMASWSRAVDYATRAAFAAGYAWSERKGYAATEPSSPPGATTRAEAA